MLEVSASGSWRATLSTAEARQIAAGAMDEADLMSVPVTVAVVDESGVLKHFERMDGACADGGSS